MSKKAEELKTVILICYKCGWSFNSNKDSCPMCGAEIVINAKELARILGEYIERQGFWISKKECENFIKTFKSKNKRLPTLDELWKSAVDYAKVQLMDEKELKKAKEKQDLELKAQIEQMKKKKLEEKKLKEAKVEKKESIVSEKEKISIKPEEKEIRIKELELKRIKEPPLEIEQNVPKEKPIEEFIICPNCKFKNPTGSRFCSECGSKLE